MTDARGEAKMPNAKDHQNKLLISLTDGKKLGEIKDLYLDGEVNKVVAAFLGTEGLLIGNHTASSDPQSRFMA
jgi:uncharacterized protein YrrD